MAALTERGQTFAPGATHSLGQRFVETGIVIREETARRKILSGGHGGMVRGGFKVVEEADEVTLLTEGPLKQIGVELSRRHALPSCQRGGKPGGFAGHHPDGFESHRAPRDMGGAEADRHDEIVHAPRQQTAPGNLRRTRFLGEDQFAVVGVTGTAIPGAIVRIHRPIGKCDAIRVNRRTCQAGGGAVVMLGEDMAADDAPCLADIHLIRDVVTVGELIERQADTSITLARFRADGLVVLQKPHQSQREVFVAFDDLFAFGPGRFGIGVVFSWQNRRVERRLAVEPSRAHEPPVVIDVFLALVSRRFLRQADVAGFVAEAEAIVVSLHRAVGRARTLRVNRSLTVAVKAKVQLAGLRILRTGFFADVGVEFARMRLVIFVASFASDAIGNFRQRGEVAFVSGVDISDAGYSDVVLRAVFAQR